MSQAAVSLPINHIHENYMQVDPPPSGTWGYIGFVIAAAIGGAMTFVGWLRKNNVSNADADAHVDSIKNLQEILAAERADHAAEVAALRQENAALRDRADKFAAERNELMQKYSEVAGELRAVRLQLAAVEKEVAALRGATQ